MTNTFSNYLIPSWPTPAHIISFTTLKTEGNSTGHYNSYNLAHHVDDNPDHVKKNRRQLIDNWSLPIEPQWLNQTHSTRVISLTEQIEDSNADACITTDLNRPCVVLTADCLPILLCDQSGQEVAAIHAGWRGLLNGIIDNTVHAMQHSANHLLAWLGPAIGPSAFAINNDIKQQFMTKNPAYRQAFKTKNNTIYGDLYNIARNNLKALGVRNIYGGDYCTYTDHSCFFSYRRQNITGRMATLIMIGAK
jgi:polyphenol oxidase